MSSGGNALHRVSTLRDVSFSDFMIDVPGWARLLLAIALTVGITLLVTWRLHDQVIHLDDVNLEAKEKYEAEQEELAAAAKEAGVPRAADPPRLKKYVGPPETFYLGQLVRGLAMTAFVFLLAFTLGNFWGNTSQARSSTLDETASWTKAMTVARTLPADQGGPAVVAALQEYRSSVEDVEWPLMQHGDADGAFEVQSQAGARVAEAMLAADESGAGKSLAWSELSDSVTDMLSDGTNRIAQVPTSFAPAVIWLIAILALAQLVLAVAFQPARLGPNLLLMGVLATITVLMMFVVVEASNPYVGGGAVTLPKVSQSL